MVELALVIIATGLVSIASFTLGALVGSREGLCVRESKTNKDEEEKLSESLQKPEKLASRERKLDEIEKSKIEQILKNIEAYDGTEAHQEDVPRG